MLSCIERGTGEKMQKSIRMRFFITYLCVVLPFLAMSMLIHSLSMHQMRQDAQAQLTSRLERVVSGLDIQYARYYESGAYLAGLPELSPSAMLASAVNARHGMDRLKTVYVFDRMIDDLLLYYDENHLYGSSGLARAAVYLRGELALSAEQTEGALSLLSSDGSGGMSLECGEDAGYLLLHYPMPSGISVNYCIALSTFSDFLQGLAGDEDMMIRVALPCGDPLYFGSRDGSLRHLQREYASALSDHGKWISAAGETGQIGTQVEICMDERLLHANMSKIQYSNYILLIVGMLLSGLLSVSFTNRRMTQLRNLEAAVTGGGETPSKMGEFSDIHTLIRRTIRENIAEVGDFRALLRAQTARLLFHGLLREEREYAPLLEKCGLEPAEEFFFVAAVWAEGIDVSALLADRLYTAAEAGGKTIFLYLDELPNLDESGQLRRIRGERASARLHAAGAEHVLAVMSVAVDHLGAIDYAYLNALTEMNRQLEAGNMEKICIAEEPSAMQKYEFPAEEMEEFTQALLEYNGTKAQKMLKKMLTRMSDTALSPEIRQYLYYSMLQPIAAALNKSENPEDERLLMLLNQQIPEETEAFSAQLLDAVEQYCRHNASAGDGAEILQYVRDNYRREDISLEEMATHFGVSREHMSRLFRARTGMRYIDYVTRLRMEAAWEMITGTDQSITDIFRMVGYIDRSSSTRKFKKYFGVTPSEARARPILTPLKTRNGEDGE